MGGYILRCLLITPGSHQDTDKIKEEQEDEKQSPSNRLLILQAVVFLDVSWTNMNSEDMDGRVGLGGRGVSLVAKVRHPNSLFFGGGV